MKLKRKIIEKANETKIWFFEKINTLTRLTTKQRKIHKLSKSGAKEGVSLQTLQTARAQ